MSKSGSKTVLPCAPRKPGCALIHSLGFLSLAYAMRRASIDRQRYRGTDPRRSASRQRPLIDDTSKPLFLYVASLAPHAPYQAPQEAVDAYKDLPGDVHRQTYAAMIT